MKDSHNERVPDALLIDDASAAISDTVTWTRQLQAAGVDTQALHWLARRAPRRAHRIAEGDFTRFRDTVLGLGGPIVIGRGNGAAVTYRLLAAGAPRAGVLIAARDLPSTPIGTHSPMLLLHNSATELQVEALRKDGICDQQSHDAEPNAAVPHDADANLTQYIHDWLEFHHLLTR